MALSKMGQVPARRGTSTWKCCCGSQRSSYEGKLARRKGLGTNLTHPYCQVLNEMSKEICLGGVSEGPDWFIKVD
jgi:hypothetical protein